MTLLNERGGMRGSLHQLRLVPVHSVQLVNASEADKDVHLPEIHVRINVSPDVSNRDARSIGYN